MRLWPTSQTKILPVSISQTPIGRNIFTATFEPDVLIVETVFDLGSKIRRQSFIVSLMSIDPLCNAQTQWGELKLASVLDPSRFPGNPFPAKVSTRKLLPIVINTHF